MMKRKNKTNFFLNVTSMLLNNKRRIFVVYKSLLWLIPNT